MCYSVYIGIEITSVMMYLYRLILIDFNSTNLSRQLSVNIFLLAIYIPIV